MNGMIFAAGLGTRLAPLTLSKPKALVEVGGEPLLSRAINHLVEAGVNHIVVNVHHFAGQIIDYVDSHRCDWSAEIVISDESDLLLDTGGGLFKALPLFPDDSPIVIGNADVVCDAPLSQLVETHKFRCWDATLMTSPRHSTRHLLFDGGDRLCGWEDVKMTNIVKPALPLSPIVRLLMVSMLWSSVWSALFSPQTQRLAPFPSSMPILTGLPISLLGARLFPKAAIGSMSAQLRNSL